MFNNFAILKVLVHGIKAHCSITKIEPVYFCDQIWTIITRKVKVFKHPPYKILSKLPGKETPQNLEPKIFYKKNTILLIIV